ncbi:MAG TPA: type II toxin-antitoxin system MqsR family toxin [Spirochaetota bacterium]|nr:type II toxin-antitoxin system MqsR family toxin [Spirochaetota bacterium]HOD16803.1 type II toxin-antitoxin system MqsR family toxin [Spirochaetota bacterium]HPG51710.1 type II toxin-antitoxin system MqsR family toxin [Spirochaetota bacterium]HPN12922.1 type II toxin-antitoxin system MqsR family toxin [Spirochaetota bacterium]HPV40614.1 type II toxin-antitoxin system MqsR family toxin [Spirochaetota bacterium]
MDKFKAHYSLLRVKTLVKEGRYRITATAIKSAFEDFSLLSEELAEWVLRLEASDLYKSMTSRFDTTLWQDVYHKKIITRIAYIKLQILDDETVIISFKEK